MSSLYGSLDASKRKQEADKESLTASRQSKRDSGINRKLEDLFKDVDEEEFKLFREYLHQSYSHENLAFWLQVEDFKQMNEPLQIKEAILDIYNKYIKTGSPYEINIAYQLKTQIENEIRNNNFNLQIFDNVQRAIFQLLEEDCYPKFLKSDLYKKFLASNEAVEATRTRSSTYHLLMKYIRSQSSALGTYKVELTESIEICKHIEGIYKDIEYGESVDFISTIKEVMETLHSIHSYSNNVNSNNSNNNINANTHTTNTNTTNPNTNTNTNAPFLDFDVLHDLFTHLKEYYTLLDQLKSNGRLERFITSNRLRRKLDEFNYKLHSKLMLLKSKITNSQKPNNDNGNANDNSLESIEETMKSLSLQYSKENNGNSLPLPPPIPKEASFHSNYETLNAISNPIVEENKVEIIVDVEGKNFWQKYFRLYNNWVTFDELIGRLQSFLSYNITPEEERVLKFLLDGAGVGSVNQHKFSEFLKAFGPIKSEHSNCIKNMKIILREKWFYGFLSKIEAQHLLFDQPTGTFLIRFSKTKMGSFAIAFVAKKKIFHILVNSCKPIGFKVFDNSLQTEKTFHNLLEIVKHYSYALKIPYENIFPYEKWFQGDLSAQESAELLDQKPPGTFLIRFSHSLGGFAASYIDSRGQVNHLAIQSDGTGKYYTSTEDGHKYFKSIQELVDVYKPTILKSPLPNPVTEIQGIIHKWRSEIINFEQNISNIFKDILDT